MFARADREHIGRRSQIGHRPIDSRSKAAERRGRVIVAGGTDLPPRAASSVGHVDARSRTSA